MGFSVHFVGVGGMRETGTPRRAQFRPAQACRLTTALALCLLAGCADPRHACDSECVSDATRARTGLGLGPDCSANQVVVPPGWDSGRALDEAAAVLLAVWNNTDFREAMVELQYE